MNKTAIENHGTSVVRPDDFEAFWADVVAQAEDIPLNASVERNALRSTPEVDVFDVHYDSLDRVRIAAISLP